VWTRLHELLAQVVEVTSVPAAEHKLTEPVDVPRPLRARTAETEFAAGAVTVEAAMSGFASTGQVRPSAPGGG
jgi:hypothetical protein